MIFQHSGAVSTVLLRVHDGLRCFASTGKWRTSYALPLDAGAVGDAYATGRTIVDYPVDPSEAAYPLGPDTVMAASVPIRAVDRTPIGVLTLEWDQPVEPIRWQTVVEPTVGVLGELVMAMGYTPAETMAERLVRHALAISASDEEAVLVGETLRAARQISGLSTAVGVRTTNRSSTLSTERDDPGPLAEAVRGLSQAELAEVCDLTHRSGTWYTCAEPSARWADHLARVGARTVIAIPSGVRGGADRRPNGAHRTLLVLDERPRMVSPTTVGLLELLTAQALISLERLWLLESMRVQAGQDPLTGLGHQVTLGERMDRARPGRTVLLLVDVDHFKEINDSRGHAAGDHVLVELAEALQGALRSGDELYRLGGDEFVAVLEVNHIAEARSIAKRLTRAAHWVGCTVSVGAAMRQPHDSGEDTLRRADAAMYRAKRDGRDQAQFAAVGPPPVPGSTPHVTSSTLDAETRVRTGRSHR